MEVGRGGTGNRRFPPKVVSEPWGHSVRRPRTPHRCAWGQEVTPHPFSSLHYKYLRPERSSQKLPASRGASFLRPGTARRPRAPAPRRLTALCRPRCPRAAAAAGGVRGGDHEAQPEEDAAHRGEEGAPGRGLPGRGGRHGRLQGLL